MKNAIAVALATLSLSALAQTLPPAPGAEATKLVIPRAGTKVATAAPAAKAPALDEKLSQKVPAQPLPGLGTMPGEKQLSKSVVIRVQSDRNEIVYVSGTLPNRIATPFESPRLIDIQDVDFQTVGQNIFLLPKDPEKPVAVYITGSNANDPVVSMTLVPKNIPQQTIVLQLDAPMAKGMSASDAEQPPTSDVYSERIRYVLRQVALNKAPEGFVEGALPAATAVLNGVTVTPVSRYSGPAYDIYRYRIKGTGTEVELNEEAFFSQGVRAVAFFPTAVLRKDDVTTVFVIADKSATEN